MRFKDKVVIITGSSRGIGKATALEFAKEGAKVVVNYYKSESEAKEVVNKIKNLGSEAIAIKCDVSKEEQVKQMIKETVKVFGKVDILVNNTGIVFDVPFVERTVEQWKRTLEVNLIGVFLCSKYVAPYMKNGGKIVNVSSTNGIDSFNPASMDYDASKAGIIILTRNLAKELAPSIQINSVAPGWVDTDINKDLPKEFVDEETQKTILFLASDEASYITGSTLKVDGGYG